MTEQVFESAFHKRYVGGEGVVVEKPLLEMPERGESVVLSLEGVVAHFRQYVGVTKEEMSDEEIEQYLNLIV